ncbi:Alpha/Beta hydrolase protein [Biscogniauxia sp. FL1348]|nr:Alpha/Beta hydrolase protein [Biscogniauxia sp. FL1348]
MELGLSVLPPITAHTHTIIFLHDRGDTARNLADTLFWSRDSYRRSLKDIFPSVRWVFPQSELRPCERDHPSSPQTSSPPSPAKGRRGGRRRGGSEEEEEEEEVLIEEEEYEDEEEKEQCSQWFDVWNPLDYSDREELQAPGLRDSVLSVRRLVAREARAVGGLSRVVLAGISQGAATAVHVLLNMPLEGTQIAPSEMMAVDEDEDEEEGDEKTSTKTTPPARLAAFVGFACRMPFPGGTLAETREILGLPPSAAEDPDPDPAEVYDEPRPSDEVVRRTPAFLAHCADDAVVFVEYGKQLAAQLRDLGVRDVAWREYDDGGHWINSPRGVDDLVEFLRAQGLPAALPPRPYMGSISMSPD